MINYNSQSRLIAIKYAVIEFWQKNKFWIILLGSLMLIALLTGIFTSIKLYNLDNDINLDDYSVNTILNGNVYSFGYFLLRILSCLIIAGLLYLFSLSKFTYFLGLALIIYRAYLVTLNCTFIVIKLGVGGIISSLLIVLPCQLLFLFIMCVLFILFMNINKQKSQCGTVDKSSLNLMLVLLLLFLVVDIVEIILLVIFKPTTILII